jgi:hypothetical protein
LPRPAVAGATASDRRQQPVDRRPFLRPAREVDAAQQDSLVEPRRAEDLADELAHQRGERGHLLREAEHLGAPPRVGLLLEPGVDPLVEPHHQRIQLGSERLGGPAAHRLLARERDAPDLRAPLGRQVAEVLAEAGHEVALRHEHVHRQLHPQLLVQFVEPPAGGGDVRRPAVRPQRHQVLRADGEDDAVQRPPLAVLPQQLQELAPRRRVGRGVGVLRRVAPRRVEEHRFVGEPPVAVPRPAHAPQRALAHALLQRELQA